MVILVTNDDGYSWGLKLLLKIAKSIDKNSYAIIPNYQKSAVSKAITLHKPIRINKRENDIYEINGTPADCVNFAVFCSDFKKPDLVLSGINWGDNTSIHSLYSSGTLAACTEASLFGVKSLGFSLYKEAGEWKNKQKVWGSHSAISLQIKLIIKKLMPFLEKDLFFSININEKAAGKDIVFAIPQRNRFSIRIYKKMDPDGKPYFWIKGPASKKEKNSDFDLLVKGKTVITPIRISPVDMDAISKLKNLF
ncbi:MAG: 5'/3'-nucleotidase SurE [Candidatus Micrarchaeia archaeon]